MPTTVVNVWQVDEWPDPRGFSVFVVRTDGPRLTTTSAFSASLCQRAKELHRLVKVTWQQEGWGVRRGRLSRVELDA